MLWLAVATVLGSAACLGGAAAMSCGEMEGLELKEIIVGSLSDAVEAPTDLPELEALRKTAVDSAVAEGRAAEPLRRATTGSEIRSLTPTSTGLLPKGWMVASTEDETLLGRFFMGDLIEGGIVDDANGLVPLLTYCQPIKGELLVGLSDDGNPATAYYAYLRS